VSGLLQYAIVVYFVLWKVPRTVGGRVTPCVAWRLTNIKTPDQPISSTRHNSTTIAPIDKALEYLKSQEPGEKLSYRKVAEIFSVSDTTLRRKHKGCQGSVEAKNQA
jgi:hypothetical protein